MDLARARWRMVDRWLSGRTSRTGRRTGAARHAVKRVAPPARRANRRRPTPGPRSQSATPSPAASTAVWAMVSGWPETASPRAEATRAGKARRSPRWRATMPRTTPGIHMATMDSGW